MLVGPHFCFASKHEPAGAQPGVAYRLSDLELASRLSFFLWSSIPDDELLDVAAQGDAARSDSARAAGAAHARRPASRRRWSTTSPASGCYLRDLAHVQTPAFPDFDDNLRQAFQRETELFSRAWCARTAASSTLLTRTTRS